MDAHSSPPTGRAFGSAPRTTTLGVLALTLALAGCGDSGGSASDLVVRDTLPDGTPRTHHTALAPDSSVPMLVPDLVLGRLEGDGPDVFGDVRGIEAGDDGEIFVLDSQAREVRVFGPEGNHRRTLSRGGEGPGEIGATNGFVRVADTLFVYDHGKFVIMGLHTGDGRELVRYPTPVRSYGYIWSGARDQEGRHWKGATQSPGRTPGVLPENGLQETEVFHYMVVYDPATQRVDSVSLGSGISRAWVQRMGEGGVAFWRVPFDRQQTVAVDPAGGFWSSSGGEYRIARLDETGDTVAVLEAAVEPRPVTDADRDGVVRERLGARAPDIARSVAEMLAIAPTTHPVVGSLFIAADHLWVVRTPDGDGSKRVDVFDRDGSYRGSVRLPTDAVDFMTPRIRGGHAYLLLRDELDVSYVARAPLPEGLVEG